MQRGTTPGWAGRREFPSQVMGAGISTRTGGLSPTPSLALGGEFTLGTGQREQCQHRELCTDVTGCHLPPEVFLPIPLHRKVLQ